MNLQSFEKALNASAADLRQTRVSNFVKNAKADADLLIQTKERTIRQMEDRLSSLLDLGEDNTMSIAKKVQNVNTNQLMSKIYQLSVDIELAKQDLEIMKKVNAQLFPEKEETK
jgi:hypothetical protein